MDSPDKTFSELVRLLKSWIPWRSEPPGVSRDFWMPDKSCMVCYECDSQFTVFNRRHHCRLCGRVFCAKCTSNSVPFPSGESSTAREEWERIRVCKYCFQLWQQGVASFDNGIQVSSQDLINSSSFGSFATTRSSGTVNSISFTLGSVPYSVGRYHQAQHSSSGPGTQHTEEMENGADNPEESNVADVHYQSSNQYTFSMNRSDDDEDEYILYQSDSETRHFSQVNNCYHQYDDISHDGLHKAHLDGEAMNLKSLSSSPINHSFGPQGLEGISHVDSKDGQDMDDEGEAPSSMYPGEDGDAEPVDFENNAVLWLPPEPEDEEDERDGGLFDDDDDDDGNVSGEWGCLRSSGSFGSGEFRNRDRSTEEHKQAMKNVVDGHFRALVAQLLQVENVPILDEDNKESWLDIITSLSWEAATLLKPDMSKGGQMDPGGYVKVKCVACGHRSESMVVKGVVCKKNVAHRRMTSKIEKPRLLILGGALEYQRVSNHLSSLDTLLQQEMDHLKMAVAKIDAHQPNVLLVEKSVSRFAQDYLLTKDISLVLNIKRSLLERIARCTGAQIIPSIDHFSSPKLGYCETFHVERFLEDLGSAGQGGKKLVKTLMYFDGCPKPLGFTILLRGANGDELKKVKHVVKYGVFAAYHLALETSFLADEGASLPELPLNSPITVALPDKPLSIERSISTVPGFAVSGNEKSQGPISEPQRANSVPICLASTVASDDKVPRELMTSGSRSQSLESTSHSNSSVFLCDIPSKGEVASFSDFKLEKEDRIGCKGSFDPEMAFVQNGSGSIDDKLTVNGFRTLDDVVANCSPTDLGEAMATHLHSSEVLSQQDCNVNTESMSLKEEFPPSPSDHQSILVSLSSRCVWKGTVCERSHLFRIKYYGNFDKPLGRFLRDHLFDQGYTCCTCQMPSEAHVHCYTHRQGTLTISVKKLPEILLPGEKDGKIWMWHRCLKCPRTNSFPPATRRVVMSDAAWGLSFGKFLELSFSNHAAASRVASCGHSLHRDCLRFYGFGKMVACFRYASIDVLSVYVPPPKLDFNCNKQDWLQKEINELVERAEVLFSEVLYTLGQIAEKRSSGSPLKNGLRTSESRNQFSELEALLQKEKGEFEESLQKIVNREVKKGLPAADILDINRLQRQLLFQSYMWDHRLIYLEGLVRNGLHDSLNGLPTGHEEKAITNNEKLIEMNVSDIASKDLNNNDSPKQLNCNDQQGGFGSATDQSGLIDEETDMGQDSNHGRDNQSSQLVNIPISDQSDQMEFSENVHGATSVGQASVMANLSDTLDAAWTGESHQVTGIPKDSANSCMDSAAIDSSTTVPRMDSLDLENHLENQNGGKVNHSLAAESSIKGPDNVEDSVSWLKMPFLSFYRSLNNFLATSEKLDTLGNYNPVYVYSFRELELQSGARLLLPVGVNDTVIPVYDDEPTSIISHALVSPEYHGQIIDEGERLKDNGDLSYSFNSFESLPSLSMHSVEDVFSESHKSLGSIDESILSTSGSRSSLVLDPVSYTKAMHVRISFGDDGPLGKVRYSVTCYYAKHFEALRKICCPSELDFIRSLSRCKKWGAQGGKSNVFFAKTLDDRFIIKQVPKTELESFIKFAPEYFKYLSESISSRSPTCLAKILGIYQVTTKHQKGGKESKMDLLVMENLLFERNVTRLYDLKGSTRSRYNSDSSGNNKVLLDQNLIEAMPTAPIFVGNKAKRLLERAVWNDTSFLASIGVMDYSLLVGVDEENHELVLGIIDFMRQYTWDKHLETWVKTAGILGGPKNTSPTVISPKQYKKRFRKAMTTYFLMVPDQWSPPFTIPCKSQSELCKENTQDGELS